VITVFTPTHNPKYLQAAYDSLLAQTNQEWEWIIVLNNAARDVTEFNHDPRVRVYRCPDKKKTVGYYKRWALEQSPIGDVYLELDHDDTLEEGVLADIKRQHEWMPEASLYYGATSQMTADGGIDTDFFREDYGWRYATLENGFHAALIFPPHPHNLNYIWFAPNHYRAINAEAYRKTNGYNPDIPILDDQDIMTQLYQVGPFVRSLDSRAVYYQRMHKGNTQRIPKVNQNIQELTVQMYDQNIEKAMLKWCEYNDYLAIDLGAAHGKPEGYFGIDMNAGPGVDWVGDFMDWKPDKPVGLIRASDFIEHLPDKQATIERFYELLVHGGMALINVPSTDGRGAYQDPTHVSYWNENSFWYYTDANMNKFIDSPVRFQASRLITYFPSQFHQQHNISYVKANLIAIKQESDLPEFGGPLLI